jgi:nitroreductase
VTDDPHAPSLAHVIRSQRACRDFLPDPLDDAVIEQVLEAATYAPSAENRQPWVFVVVADEDLRSRIGELTRRAWRSGARAASEPRLTPSLMADVDRGAEGGVSGAPVLVVVCGDCALGHAGAMPASVFPAVQNLLLAATAAGLGSALTTLPVVYGDELASLLSLPAHVRPMAVVPLGRPARRLGPPRRRGIASCTYLNRYGETWMGEVT